MKIEIERVHGLDGSGIALTILCHTSLRKFRTQVFKTDGSATRWCWLKDGSQCPPEVWQAWEAYKVKNILSGKPSYEADFTEIKEGKHEIR